MNFKFYLVRWRKNSLAFISINVDFLMCCDKFLFIWLDNGHMIAIIHTQFLFVAWARSQSRSPGNSSLGALISPKKWFIRSILSQLTSSKLPVTLFLLKFCVCFLRIANDSRAYFYPHESSESRIIFIYKHTNVPSREATVTRKKVEFHYFFLSRRGIPLWTFQLFYDIFCRKIYITLACWKKITLHAISYSSANRSRKKATKMTTRAFRKLLLRLLINKMCVNKNIKLWYWV
jgi:hypothetical protein